MTIEDLARLTQEGFLEMRQNFSDLRNDVRHDIKGLQSQVAGIDRRIDDIALNKVGYKELDLILAPIRNKLAL